MKMKMTLAACLTCLISLVGNTAFGVLLQEGEPVSVLSTMVAPSYQDVFPSPITPAPAVAPATVVQPPAPIELDQTAPTVVMHPSVSYQPVMTVPVAAACCQQSNRRKCRCPKPAPVPMEICLVDPCGCSHVACVEVPVCCLGMQPSVTWRNGVGGRQIATLCWNCCDHQTKVVVTGAGKVRTRG